MTPCTPQIVHQLPRGEVHIWQQRLEGAVEAYPELLSSLPADEQARAESYRRVEHRHRFVVARVFLRRLLAHYLDFDPGQIRFRIRPHGKPMVANPAVRTNICFSTAKSDGRAVVALARQREVGIDIERIRPDFDFDGIVRRFFSTAERTALALCPAEQRATAFFHTWACKEAYVKARGDGLRRPLASFDVTIPRDATTLVSDRYDPAAARQWMLRSVPTEPGFALAVCAEGDDWSVRNPENTDEEIAVCVAD